MIMNLINPTFYVFKRLSICNIKCQYNTMRTLVVSMSDGAETFLSSSIPNLKLIILIIDFYSFELIINSYS